MINTFRQPFFSLCPLTSLLLVLQFLLSPLGTSAAQAQTPTTPSLKFEPGSQFPRAVVNGSVPPSRPGSGTVVPAAAQGYAAGTSTVDAYSLDCISVRCVNPITITVNGGPPNSQLVVYQQPGNFSNVITPDGSFRRYPFGIAFLTTVTTPPGIYTYTFTLSSPGSLPAQGSSTLQIDPPLTSTILAGQTATYSNLLLASSGNGTGLSLSGVPGGATASIVPSFVQPNQSANIAITNTGNVPSGSYTLTINPSDPFYFRSQLLLVVNSATVGLSVNNASPSVNPGTSASYTITAARPSGYTGPINLNVNAPSFPGTGQANTVLAPLTLTGSQLSASLIVDVPQRTQTGTYNLSVSANSPNATLSPPTINLNLSVNPINDAVFVSQNLPDYLYPSEVRSGSVTMQNTGSTTWSAAVAYRLGFPNPGAAGPFAPNNWNSGRVDVPANVTPGQNTTFNFNLTAPTTPGTFTFQSQMVQENVQWFGQFTAAKSIVVGYPDLVVTDFSINSANPTVGQPATFTVTVLNQGTNPTPAGVPIGIGFYANGAGLGVAAFAATPLAPGQSSTVTSNAWTPSVGGAQAITAFVDDINRLGSTEANKANNTLTKTVNIVGPSVRILDSTGGDITGSTQNVLVGQQIILQTRIDNAPAGTNPTGTWTIPGSVGTIPIPGSTGSPAFAIGGWNPVVTGSGSPTLLSTQTLSQPSVTFYYVSPSNPPPASGTGQQTVSYKVNINGADYTGSVILNIRRPKASVVASILSSVLVGFQNGNCSSNPIISLKFGDTCQSDLSDAGISFTQTGENAPGGTYNFIQVLNTQFQSGTKQAATSSTGGDSLIAAPALSNLLDTATNAKDTNIFYPRNQTTPVKSSDSPSSSLTNVNSYGRADSFSTWLVYNPGTPQGINVPLQKFNWSWQGNVPRSLNGRNGAFQTTPAGSIAGAATIGSIPVDTLEFPFWGNGPANNFSSPISSSIPINSVLGGSTSGTVAAGSTLRLNGTFYDFATGKFNVASVTVNGTPAAYSIPDTSTLVITVSSGTPAGSALISITSTNGLITSVPVTVVPGIPPTITSFTPAAGLPYSKVTINGSGFSATSSVSFGSLPTGYIVNSDTQITATVPVILGIPPVRIIVVTPFGSAVSSASFQVTPPTLFRVVTEDGALPVLRAFSQYYTGYPSAPNSPTGSPRNSAVRFNYVPSSRTTTVGCFTGASACP